MLTGCPAGMIKKRTRPQPRIREPSVDIEDQLDVEDESEEKLPYVHSRLSLNRTHDIGSCIGSLISLNYGN